jgi:hypothetical protein
MLIVQGQLLTDQNTHILIYEFNTKTNKWVEIESSVEQKEFMLILDPEESYQVWFSQSNGYTKILYVDPGEAGLWTVNLNLNFADTSKLFSHMYQMCSDEGPINYTNDIIKKKATENIPATTCVSYPK